MTRTERIIHGILCALLGALMLVPIILAPVMREPTTKEPPPLEMVCHTDSELIGGQWEEVSKCHEE